MFVHSFYVCMFMKRRGGGEYAKNVKKSAEWVKKLTFTTKAYDRLVEFGQNKKAQEQNNNKDDISRVTQTYVCERNILKRK